MKTSHLIAIAFIFVLTSFAWWFLGGTISIRTAHMRDTAGQGVSERWGPPLVQQHPRASYQSGDGEKLSFQPATSDVKARLTYLPVKMGLMWQRTYGLEFEGHYTFTNPASITQKVQISLDLPTTRSMLDKVVFTLGEGDHSRRSLASPENGVMVESIELAPGQSIPVLISYQCRGTDVWRYAFADSSRIRDFQLAVSTDFDEVNYPISSPTHREDSTEGLALIWKYDDAISAPGIAVEMPRELNAGPVAAQIAFWSPLSLLLFFGVLVITCIVRGTRLHPVNYLLLAAGFFAFPLLFSYMLDVIPVQASFGIAAVVSMALVCGYLRAATGEFMFRIAIAAQFAYMVLFSASFFFKGLTGLTLTLGGIVTLAVLMALTAKVDWSQRLGGLSPKLA
ncbi:MAG: inner membrane CreD family protein [Verrucomicrobiaceae bacterium]|nr:inner membrane CreD family protein [Verrucomicrobiaceae bacterium]